MKLQSRGLLVFQSILRCKSRMNEQTILISQEVGSRATSKLWFMSERVSALSEQYISFRLINSLLLTRDYMINEILPPPQSQNTSFFPIRFEAHSWHLPSKQRSALGKNSILRGFNCCLSSSFSYIPHTFLLSYTAYVCRGWEGLRRSHRALLKTLLQDCICMWH